MNKSEIENGGGNDLNPSTITFPAEIHATMLRALPAIMEKTNQEWLPTICTMMLNGMAIFNREIFRENEIKTKALESIKNGDVQKAIEKVKAEIEISDEELDMIFHAAQAGHEESTLFLSGFERFRSLA